MLNLETDPISWEDVRLGIDKVADYIEDELGDNTVIYGIPRGGVIPAVMVVHELESRKLNARFVTNLNDLTPSELLKLVVIDEICDSGSTFKVIEQLYPMVKTAALFLRHNSDFRPSYYAYQTNHDRWLHFPWEVHREDQN